MLQWDADERPDAHQALNNEVCLPVAVAGNFNIAYFLIVVQGQVRGCVFKQQASCVKFIARRGKAPQSGSARLSELVSLLGRLSQMSEYPATLVAVGNTIRYENWVINYDFFPASVFVHISCF